MDSPAVEPTMRDRMIAVLKGERPSRLPFVDRLEVWYKSHRRAGTLPPEFRDLSLPEIHRAVGMGQQKFVNPYGLRLRGVEVIARFEGDVFYHETDPILDSFPGLWDLVSTEKAGVTATELRTPVGKLSVRHEALAETIAKGQDPYMKEHLIKDEADLRTVAYILERAEYVARYDRVRAAEAEVGDMGFVVPLLHRIPFQQALLEYLGEVPLFYALYDNPAMVARLLELLDEQLTDILRRLAELPVLYVEFPDNLHGGMTSPRLFAEHCLPYYQRYSQILHGQGKVMGSHTDGDVKPLLALLPESGLDVCESFSPAPLTECTFEEAWQAWSQRPIIWGGIPSPLLEERIPESEFRDYVRRLLELVADRPFILGVGDMVVAINSIERVRYIAGLVAAGAP